MSLTSSKNSDIVKNKESIIMSKRKKVLLIVISVLLLLIIAAFVTTYLLMKQEFSRGEYPDRQHSGRRRRGKQHLHSPFPLYA